MKEKALKVINEGILAWEAPAVTGDIPHGDMPGDKVEVGESHIAKSKIIFPALLPLLRDAIEANGNGRAVISVYGGSGVGKSETASLITYYLNQMGIGAYTLSGDNYPRRIPMYNDAERLNAYRASGVRGMIAEGFYTAENKALLSGLWYAELDANPALAEKFDWLASYQKAAREGLSEYLGTEAEQDFDQINGIIEQFKSGDETIWLKRMGRTDTELWYDNIDFSETNVLVIEWTHGNSKHLKGIDIPIFLNSTPEETREHRRKRNRDGKVDSAFTTTVLEIEQGLLAAVANTAKIIVAKSGEILSYDRYMELMEAGK